MRGARLAHGALAVIAAGGVALASQQTARAGQARDWPAPAHRAYKLEAYQRPARSARASLSRRAASYVERLEGAPYVYGATGPWAFDCSGLTRYVYARLGRPIARTAEGQFLQFRPVSKARAWGGDLVFFHDSPDPSSDVYHVGVYEGGDEMVAASSEGSQVTWESFAWAGDTVTFGTLSH